MKNTKIVYLRTIAMVLVVFRHCLCFFTPNWNSPNPEPVHSIICDILHAFNMPVFMFISGYLFGLGYIKKGKYSDKQAFIIGKAQNLLFPYLFWGIFLILTMPHDYAPIKLATGISHLWFLWILFIIFIVAILGKKIWAKMNVYHIMLITMVFLGISVFVRKMPVIGLFSIYFPLFLIGIKYVQFEGQISKKLSIAGIVFSSLAIIIISISNTIAKGLNPLLGTILVICILEAMTNKESVNNRFVLSFEKCSMGIYIIHHILIKVALKNSDIYQFMTDNKLLGPIVMFIITFSLSWLITDIIKNKLHIKYLLG